MIISRINLWRGVYIISIVVLAGVYNYLFQLDHELDSFINGEAALSDKRVEAIREASSIRANFPVDKSSIFNL
jgi:hypothetical protein